MNKNQIPSFLKICNMETWDPHPRRETREGAQFRHHNHSQILHNPYVTLSFVHISHLTPALAFKQYAKSSPNFLIAQNRGPGDFRGRDQCHKTHLLKKWVVGFNPPPPSCQTKAINHYIFTKAVTACFQGAWYLAGHRGYICKWL